jgi:hypothetical protein
VGQLVLPHQQILVILVLLFQRQHIGPTLLVGVGVGEGKLHALHPFHEDEVEFEHHFLLGVDGEALYWVGQSLPRSEFAFLVPDAVDGTIHVMAFGLNGGRGTIAYRKCSRCTAKVTLRLR